VAPGWMPGKRPLVQLRARRLPFPPSEQCNTRFVCLYGMEVGRCPQLIKIASWRPKLAGRLPHATCHK
jgi:hypothetical protein